MKRIKNALEELKKINSMYEMPNQPIDLVLADMLNAKVYTPVIGKFSSGKSALINTLLNYSSIKILKEDITPETAVPAELVYGETEEVQIFKNQETEPERVINLTEYKKMDMDASTVGHVRIYLRNSFLEQIPDVTLVDMPGFESGFEVHNKAIDDYLPQSMAYIVTFPADDMIVRSSVGNILKELCLNDMPICIVITKYDKKNDEFDLSLENLKESLKRFIGTREVPICISCSSTGDADEVKEFLIEEIQGHSQKILFNKYRHKVLSLLDNTEAYLKMILKNSELSESELESEEDKLKNQLEHLNGQFSNDKEEFNRQITDCVEAIKGDVEAALEAEESTLVAMAMNNQNLSDRINIIVRNTVTISVKKRLIPKVEKYLKKVSDCMERNAIDDVNVNFYFNSEQIDSGITASIVAVAAGVIWEIPIIGLIAAGVVALINKIQGDKKREEMKRQIRMKLRSEVYPQVLQKVGTSIELEIAKQIKLVNTSIEEEFSNQRTALEKAMSDLRAKLKNEKEQKENYTVDLKHDLDRITEIRKDME